jgi:hypothetical protein
MTQIVHMHEEGNLLCLCINSPAQGTTGAIHVFSEAYLDALKKKCFNDGKIDGMITIITVLINKLRD